MKHIFESILTIVTWSVYKWVLIEGSCHIIVALWGQTFGFLVLLFLNLREGFITFLYHMCEVWGAIPASPVPWTGQFWWNSETIAYFRVIFWKWDELTYIIIKDILFGISWEVIMIFFLGQRVSGGTFRSQIRLKLTIFGLYSPTEWVCLLRKIKIWPWLNFLVHN